VNVLATTFGLGLLAQAAANPTANESAAAAVQVQSVWDFVVKGGPMMIPIGLASLVALAVVIERALSLRRKKVIPPDFLPGLEAVLKNLKGDPQKALDYCEKNASPLANIFAAGIKRLDEPVERLEKRIAEAGQREVLKLRKYVRSLSVVASIAPLMGLLGTIFGMIRAFQTVASSAAALGKTELLAKGIYEAMITTAAGLLIAIPTLVAYHWIAAKIDRLVLEIDQMTVEFIEQHAVGRRRRPALVVRDEPSAAPASSLAEARDESETPVEAAVATS
jgi:biopolymer transport protein ExbB